MKHLNEFNGFEPVIISHLILIFYTLFESHIVGLTNSDHTFISWSIRLEWKMIHALEINRNIKRGETKQFTCCILNAELLLLLTLLMYGLYWWPIATLSSLKKHFFQDHYFVFCTKFFGKWFLSFNLITWVTIENKNAASDAGCHTSCSLLGCSSMQWDQLW